MLENYYKKEEAYKLPELDDSRLCNGYFVRVGIDVFNFVSKDIFEASHFKIEEVNLETYDGLGDMYIDFRDYSSAVQWKKIQDMLNAQGLVVVKNWKTK